MLAACVIKTKVLLIRRNVFSNRSVTLSREPSEARRHEKQIAALQVSVKAREKLLKEKRALKLTTTIVIVVFVNYLPIISFRIIKNVLQDWVSVDTVYAVHFSASSLVVVNSFINPLIYSVRLREFRVAFIKLLLKKNRAEAEEFEKKTFGSPNAAPNVVTNQGGETEEHNVNQAIANMGHSNKPRKGERGAKLQSSGC